MDTTEARAARARITKTEAAELAGVSTRQINRWAAAGLLRPEYGPVGRSGTPPVTYDPEEVEVAKAAWLARPRESSTG